ncbi:MAG: hypothetical protein A2Z29_00215 [Chloroflexi bacterium RBG_16_56_11]|nr:MAG: hypothetical protein A2Z29_00215 [Chloroflexi bacterium RBG_16_56_11]
MNNYELIDTPKDLEILFIRTFHFIEGAIKRQLRRKGIPPKIGAMLAEIYWLKNPSPSELARFSRRKPQTITAIVKRMEMKGLVNRVSTETKRNTYRICLTPKGLMVYQKILRIDVFDRSIETLSEKKRVQFRECLKEISIQVKKLRL